MDLSELASTVFLTLVIGGLGSLLLAKLNRIEGKLDRMTTRWEFEGRLTNVEGRLDEIGHR